jgi:hypothetical protein
LLEEEQFDGRKEDRSVLGVLVVVTVGVVSSAVKLPLLKAIISSFVAFSM